METDLLKNEGINIAQNFICADEVMKRLIEQVKIIAPTNATILITGETGVGKTELARYIHQLSGRAEFVRITTAMLNDNLVESLLFGHKKGIFTGAINNHLGLLNLTNGTVFLDEISDISATTQAKILPITDNRLFESEHSLFPLGNSEVKSNYRIIASTNKDTKNLRPDLLYRLNQIEFYITPLRQRPEDLKALTGYFLAEIGKILNKQIEITEEAFEVLKKYSWPGNIRELKNVLFKVCVFKKDDRLQAADLENILFGDSFKKFIAKVESKELTFSMIQDEISLFLKGCIEDALRKNYWHKTKTAEALGIRREMLHHYIKKLKIKRPSS